MNNWSGYSFLRSTLSVKARPNTAFLDNHPPEEIKYGAESAQKALRAIGISARQRPVAYLVFNNNSLTASQVDLDVAVVGQLAAQPDAMTTEVVLCTPHPTALMQCHPDTGAERRVIDTNKLVNGDAQVSLGSMDSDETRRVLITATLADPPPEAIQSTSAEFRFIATGYGEELSVGPGPGNADDSTAALTPPFDLADTGIGTIWLIAAALLLVIAGLLVLIRRSVDVRGHSRGGVFCA